MVVCHSQFHIKWWYVTASLTVNGYMSQQVLRQMVVCHSQSHGKWLYVTASLTANGGMSQPVLRLGLSRLNAVAVSETSNSTPSLLRIKNMQGLTSYIQTINDFREKVFPLLTIYVFHHCIPRIQ